MVQVEIDDNLFMSSRVKTDITLTLLILFTGHEGRAGMAALIIRPGLRFDGKKLFEHAVRDLPAYARPLFITLQVTFSNILATLIS